MAVYEFKCLPPNEPYRIVQLRAATLDEALQRANALWCRQSRPPELLSVTSGERCSICHEHGGHSLSCPTQWYR